MAATLTDPLLGRLVDGRYDVLSRIARGGMATVYLAIDRRLDRQVALKVMHPHLAEGSSGSEFVARFRREARAAARLTHPGLVAVLDQGVDGDNSYLAMEYVDGTNLRHRLQDDAPFTVEAALRTAEAVLAALAVAHRAGLVHRDVKPENVLLSSDGRVKVADFGLARAVTEVSATATGTVFGTVAYLAPELVAHGMSDARTDVYAVGILLYEMLTTTQPFTGATPIQVAYQHVNTDIPSPSDAVSWLPTEVDELVEALAARDPADRPIDAGTALQLVWRTRSGLPADVLSRNVKGRARVIGQLSAPVGTADADDDVPDGPLGGAVATRNDAGAVDSDDAVTQSIVLAPRHGDVYDVETDGDALRRTIALKIGSGLDPATEVEAEVEPAATTRRRRLLIALAAVLLAIAAGAWWFMTSGPGAYTSVPGGLVGMEQAAAEAVLEDAGLAVTTTQVFHPSLAQGLVTTSSPAPGERILKDGTVEVFVSKGPDLRPLPEVMVGQPADDVVAALTEAGFLVAEPTRAHHDTVPADHVISATDADDNPIEPAGQLPVNTEIYLAVSDGPAPLTVVSVVGLERQAAIVKLEDQGLVVKVTESYSEEVATGFVISQDPAAGADSVRTATATITVSLGPPLVDVPNVIGMNASKAQDTIEAAGLRAEITYEIFGRFPGARVIKQEPAEGQLPKGSAVTVTVS